MCSDSITIPLNHGKETIIDAADAALVLPHRWRVTKTTGGHWCVYRREKQRTIYLHRFLFDLHHTSKPLVDHADGDSLNNRRGNLRLCEQFQNLANNSRRSAKSGFKGVYFREGRKESWQARITCKFKQRHLGCYATPEEAARAYDEAARECWGEFARTNF